MRCARRCKIARTARRLTSILEVDRQRRAKVLELEELRRSRKQASRQYREAAAPGKEAAEAGRDLRTTIRDLEEEVKKLDEQLQDLMLRVPNMPDPAVPVGKGDDDDIIRRQWGEPKKFDFTPLPHWDLGERLGIIDFERGVKLSGSRFYVLKGLGARLQRALIQFFLDTHVSEHGYQEIYPPFMVKREIMVGSGQLPKLADNIYHDAEEDYWFVGTAEMPLTGLHAGEILPPGTLPLYYVAYTACFRREKMSAGKDMRGIKRGHQFDKVEMYKFVEPETSAAELDRLLADAEDICQRLGLTYRIRELCTGHISFAAAQVVRHRGLGAGLPGVAGGQLVLQLHGFPGAPREHPLPPELRTASRSSCTRSTAPGWPCRA